MTIASLRRSILLLGAAVGFETKALACLLALAIGALAAPAALAQADLVGEWAPRVHEDFQERGDGPDVGEYMGIPNNASNIAHADAWNASILTLIEHQCNPHPVDYQHNFNGARMVKEVSPLTQQLVAYRLTLASVNPDRMIWMDGRPHPGPNALHTWEGFSTGRWEGDTLVVDTSHLKVGYVRRNGLNRSDTARVREYFTRLGDVVTWTVIVYDPAFLTEPYIHNRDFQIDPGYNVGLWPCSAEIEVEHPRGTVPAYLPGTNDQLSAFASKYNLPLEATRAGAESMYPEFQSRIIGGYKAPAPAKRGAR